MQLSDKVKRVAKEEGLTEEQVTDMATRASLFRSLRGNRRYFGWAFRIEDGIVYDMFGVTRPPHVGTGMRGKLLPHEPCRGEGCKACHYYGEVLTLT